MGAWNHILEYVSPHSRNGSLLFGVRAERANQQRMQWNVEREENALYSIADSMLAAHRQTIYTFARNAMNFKMDI